MNAAIEALTIAEAARELKVSDSMIRKMIKIQGLPHIKFGNRVIIERADLRQWVDARKIGMTVISPPEGDKICLPAANGNRAKP